MSHLKRKKNIHLFVQTSGVKALFLNRYFVGCISMVDNDLLLARSSSEMHYGLKRLRFMMSMVMYALQTDGPGAKSLKPANEGLIT